MGFWTSLCLSAWLLCVGSAMAHFVWIESEPNSAGLLVRSGFGEPGGWDADLVGRMAGARFWMRTTEGVKPLAMPLGEKQSEYRAEISGPPPLAILGACDFGVIQFGDFPPSWLRYTAKNLVGAPNEWSDKKPADAFRIELFAALDGDHVQLEALHLGKPLAGATIKATPPGGGRVEIKTDEQGLAKWPLSAPGLYACYVGATTEEAGEKDGKKYEALKDYTTLTFTLPKSP
jgi:hypothetical protein